METPDNTQGGQPLLASLKAELGRVIEGQEAVIGLAFDPDERPSAPDALVNIVVRVLAWCLTVNMYDGGRMVQTSDKSTNAIPRVATFHTSERKRNTPAAYKTR